MLAMKNHLS